MLQALVAGVDSGDALVVATDRKGFPVAQRVLRRPRDLPRAVVIGRHNRCALSIPNDNRVSLRHVLLTAWPGDGPWAVFASGGELLAVYEMFRGGQAKPAVVLVGA